MVSLCSIHTKPISNDLAEVLRVGIKLFRLGLYDDALECFEFVSALYQQSEESEIAQSSQTSTIAYNYFVMGSAWSR